MMMGGKRRGLCRTGLAIIAASFIGTAALGLLFLWGGKDADIKERDERIAGLEAAASNGDELRAARLEVAFLRAAITSDTELSDLDTAWTLGHSKGYFDAPRGGRKRWS